MTLSAHSKWPIGIIFIENCTHTSMQCVVSIINFNDCDDVTRVFSEKIEKKNTLCDRLLIMIPMRSNVAIKITKKKERMKPFTRKHFFYDVKIMRGTAAVYGVFVTIFSLPTHLFLLFFCLWRIYKFLATTTLEEYWRIFSVCVLLACFMTKLLLIWA